MRKLISYTRTLLETPTSLVTNLKVLPQAAQDYGQKIMAGKGSTWHRFGDELLNVAALRWMEYKSDERAIKFDNGSIPDVSRRQFEDAARDFNAAGALATGGKVSSVMRFKDELLNLNA